MNQKKRVDTDGLVATLCALCFFLSTLEFAIPKPLPFLRIGLANLPLMLSIDLLPFPSFCLLVLLKVIGQGIVGGTLFSYIFLFSAAGTVSSAIAMLALKKAFPRSISYVGISVAGAFASNAAQLLLARWFIFGPGSWYIAPPFFAVGTVTGAVLGAFANRFASRSRWYADVSAGKLPDILGAGNPHAAVSGIPVVGRRRWCAQVTRFACGIALLAVLLFAPRLAVRAAVCVVAFALVFRESRVRPLPVLFMSAGIVAFNLYPPTGKVLASPFGLPVTEGALLSGIKKALTVEGMVFISRWMLKPGVELPGRPGRIASRAFGILGYLAGSTARLNPKNLVDSVDRIMYGRD